MQSHAITISPWFQRALTSAWEKRVLIPTSKTSATSYSSHTFAPTIIIKFNILSSKRTASLSSCSPAHRCREHSYIRALLHYSLYFMHWSITSVWAGDQLCPGRDTLAVESKRTLFYLLWGTMTALLLQWVTVGWHKKLLESCPGRVSHIPQQVLGVGTGSRFATSFPDRRNPETQISFLHHLVFSISATSNNLFFLPFVVKFSNFCHFSEGYISIN